MRKETREILSSLGATHSKRVLVGLWSDLQALSKEAFEGAIGAPAKSKAPKRARQPQPAKPGSDRPAARIANLLLEKCALSPSEASDGLRQQLVRQRIAATRIPALEEADFEAWLTRLFKTVPSSKVLHAAVELSKAVDQS